MSVSFWTMTGVKVPLLLAAFLSVVKCQQKPTVTMSPDLKQVFLGDLFHLNCDGYKGGDSVKWFLGGTKLNSENKTLRIAAATQSDSGPYKCEINGQKSNSINVKVLEYAPSASLTIQTGNPVMERASSVILKLENDEGVKGWVCKVNRGSTTKTIKLKPEGNPTSLLFQLGPLSVTENIFWCIHQNKSGRSDQVIIRTSGKRVSLEMNPLPAVAGESLTLTCIAWGSKEITAAEFYKDDTVIQHVKGSYYKIDEMTNSRVGKYKCVATYRYDGQTVSPHRDASDFQELPIYASPVRAELSEDMSCSCSLCDKTMSYRYYKQIGESWRMLSPDQKPESSGTYRCRAVMEDMRTLPSRALVYNSSFSSASWIIYALCFIAILLIVFAGVYCFYYKKRHDTGPIYEDVALKLQDREGGYQELKGRRSKEAEYDMLKTEGASGGEGGYQELQTGGSKEAEYDTLKVEGASGGEGGYQELKKGDRKEEVYHSLGDHVSAAESEGGYEALKKEKMQKSEYETLQTTDAERRPGGDTEKVEEIDEDK